MSNEGKKEIVEKSGERRNELAMRPRREDRYLSPYEMMRDFDRLFDDFRRELDEMFWNPWKFPSKLSRMHDLMPELRTPSVDIVDTGKEYKISAELPGVSKDEIEVNLTENGIEISSETKKESEEKKDEKDNKYLRRERTYSKFYRAFNFPEEVLPDKAEAKLENGILEIMVPKKEVKEKKHKVQIK
ncbi:MAG: Hsp20/alpha crystallin family protein [Thermoplasmata archaeon]